MADKAGSVAGKPELFQRHAMPHLDALYSAALHLTRNRDDAQDLLQETVLRAFRFFDQFTPGTNCRAWLLTILYNTFHNGYRRAARERAGSSAVQREAQLHAAPDWPPGDPEAIVLAQLIDHEVERALASLPEEFRATLMLVDLQELSYQEASQVLKVPIGTVRSRLSRGRAIMRAALGSFAKARGYLRS